MSDQQNSQFNSPPPTKRKAGHSGGSSSKSNQRSQVNTQVVNIVEILNEDSETVMKKYVSVAIENQYDILIQEVNEASVDAGKDIDLDVSEQRQCLQARQIETFGQDFNVQKSNNYFYQQQHQQIQQLPTSQHQREEKKPSQQSIIHYEVGKLQTNQNRMVVDEQGEDKHTGIDIDESQNGLNTREQQLNDDEDSWSARRPCQINVQSQMIVPQRMGQFERQEEGETQMNQEIKEGQNELMEIERQEHYEKPKGQETITAQPINTSEEYDKIFVLGSQIYYNQIPQHQYNEDFHHRRAIDNKLITTNHQQLVELNIIQQQVQVNEMIEVVCESQQQRSVEIDTIPIVPQYKIVVRQSPIKEYVQQENRFYKNNDIYGVQGELFKEENVLEVENQYKENNINIQWYDNEKNQIHLKSNNGEDFDMSGPSTEELRLMQQQQELRNNEELLGRKQQKKLQDLFKQNKKQERQTQPVQQQQQPQQKLPQQNQHPQQSLQLPQEPQQHQSAENNFSLAQQSTNDFTINDSLRSNVAVRGSEFPRINQSTQTNTYAHPQRNQQQQQIHNHNLNVVMQHITETQSESKKSKIPSQQPLLFGGSSTKNKTKFTHPTEQKNTQEQVYQVRFFFSKDGHDIYTVQCFKDPTSQLNKVYKLYDEKEEQLVEQQKQIQKKQEKQDEKSKMAEAQYRIQSSSFYSPSQQPSMGKYVLVEINNHQHSQQDQAFHRKKVQSQLEYPMNTVREIHYRSEDDLEMILDYLKIEQNLQKGGHEEIIDLFMKNNKLQVESGVLGKEQSEQPQIVWREDEPIKKSRMYQNQPHNIEDEQWDVSNVSSFLSKQHPAVIVETNQNNLDKKLDQQQQQKQKHSSSKKSKRVTKKKISDEIVNFETYLKKESSKKSKNSQVSFEPKGSVYKYELIHKRDKQKLVQVRRSGRIFSKSKAKLEQQLKSQEQNDQKSEQYHPRVSISKSRQASSSKKRQASHKRSNKKSMLKADQNHKKNQNVTVDWLKKHISELNEIVVENVYMEDQYKAMTQKDAEIAKFLDSLERKQIEIKKEEKNEQSKEPKKEFVREDRIMKLSKKRPQNRTTSKKSRASRSVRKRKPFTTKKQISKRLNIKIERTIQVSVKKQQMKNVDQIQQDHDNIVKLEDDTGGERSLNSPNENEKKRNLTHEEKIKLFNEKKKLYRVPDEFPLTVEKIVNPDILNLGVYALVKLGRFSEFQLGTPYAITPICEINLAKINDVKKSVEQSKKLVPKEYQDNIALVALNKKMLELIENAKNKREDVVSKNKDRRSIQQGEDIQI